VGYWDAVIMRLLRVTCIGACRGAADRVLKELDLDRRGRRHHQVDELRSMPVPFPGWYSASKVRWLAPAPSWAPRSASASSSLSPLEVTARMSPSADRDRRRLRFNRGERGTLNGHDTTKATWPARVREGGTMPVAFDSVVAKITDATRQVDTDAGASPVLVAVVHEFQSKLAKAQSNVVGGVPSRDAVLELEQAGDSAKAAAEADPGLSSDARESVLSAHLAICMLKAGA
jgi:hypothetical protein